MLMTTEDKKQIIMLTFAEAILVSMANATKPKSRRYNQLVGAIKKLENIDKTYIGALSDHDFDMAERFLSSMEQQFNDFIEKGEIND